jgi:hypothetical protein
MVAIFDRPTHTALAWRSHERWRTRVLGAMSGSISLEFRRYPDTVG